MVSKPFSSWAWPYWKPTLWICVTARMMGRPWWSWAGMATQECPFYHRLFCPETKALLSRHQGPSVSPCCCCHSVCLKQWLRTSDKMSCEISWHCWDVHRLRQCAIFTAALRAFLDWRASCSRLQGDRSFLPWAAFTHLAGLLFLRWVITRTILKSLACPKLSLFLSLSHKTYLLIWIKKRTVQCVLIHFLPSDF